MHKSLLPTFRQLRLRRHSLFLQPPSRLYSRISEKFKILFLGRDEFSCTVLSNLHGAKDLWSEIHIATQPDEKVGRRGSILSVSPLKLLGQSLDIQVHEIPHEKRAFRDWEPPHPFVPSSDPPPSHLILTASFGRILSTPLLRRFQPNRRLNIHPSNLPAYRGAAPIQHTLLNGEKSTGVCTIAMLGPKEGIDSGEVWGRRMLAVEDGIDFADLRDKLANEGGQLLVDVLRGMMAGKAQLTSQVDDPVAPRASKITTDDAVVDFDTMSAETIVRRHRAIGHQRPLTAALLSGRIVQLCTPSVLSPDTPSPNVLTSAKPGAAVLDPRSKSLVIKCEKDTYLVVSKMKQEGRPLLHAKDWWNGVRSIGGVVDGLIMLI